MLTAEYVRSQLWYDKKTGCLWWKVRASGRRMDKPAGSLHKTLGYIAIGLGGKIYRAHRLAWLIVKGVWPKHEVDHKDLYPANNRWRNLREATKGQNRGNTRAYKNNKSGFKGVSWHPQHYKWYAQLQHNNKNVFLGLFMSKKKAHDAYVAAAKKHFGEFARG